MAIQTSSQNSNEQTSSEHSNDQNSTEPSNDQNSTEPSNDNVALSDSSNHETENGLKPQLSGRSYIVGMWQWEQLMASAFNSIQLQCWIKTLEKTSYIDPQITSLSAVEPMVTHERSILGFDFSNRSLPLASDVFDMESWYTQWPANGPPLAPLTTRADFIQEIKHFHKELILAQINYDPAKGYECEFDWEIDFLMQNLEHYPLLKVVRKVCIYGLNNFLAKKFNELIFGDMKLKNTVVLISRWRGIRKFGRLNIKDSPCVVSAPSLRLRPSASVMKDAETFANQHLGGFNNYVSVSARFEKVSDKYWKMSQKQRRGAIADGISESLPIIANLKKKSHVNNAYLSYDYGKYGSYTFERHQYYTAGDILRKFQEDIYDGKLPYPEYERLLTTFKFQNPGYVAMVQMTLSANAKCLFLIGWGSCIRFVISLYKSFHKQAELRITCLSKKVCSTI